MCQVLGVNSSLRFSVIERTNHEYGQQAKVEMSRCF